MKDYRPMVLESGTVIVDGYGKRVKNTPEFPTEQEAWEYIREMGAVSASETTDMEKSINYKKGG